MTLLPANDNCRFIPPLPKETPPRPPPPPSEESDSGLGKGRSQGIDTPLCTVSLVLDLCRINGWNDDSAHLQILLVYTYILALLKV